MTSLISFLVISACDNSLGLVDDPLISLKDPNADTVDYSSFVPTYPENSWTQWIVYDIDENGSIIWGDYQISAQIVNKGAATYLGKECEKSVVNGAEYYLWGIHYHYIDGLKLYISSNWMCINRKYHSPGQWKIIFPRIENEWVLVADFGSKTWNALEDSIYVCPEDYAMRDNLIFNGIRTITGSRGDIKKKVVAGLQLRCIEIKLEITYEGELKRTGLPDTNIKYTHYVYDYYAEDNIGMLIEDEFMPAYDFGIGEVPFDGYRSAVIEFKR